MKKRFIPKLVLLVGTFCLLGLGLNSIANAFEWSSPLSKATAVAPKIWDNVDDVNNLLWGQNYICSADGESWCPFDFPTTESKGGVNNGIFYFYGDNSPDILIPINDHIKAAGFSVTFPLNAWFQQAFWSNYQSFDPTNPDNSKISGNNNCVNAGWSACTIKTLDGSYSYNSPIYVYPQPLGIQLSHPLLNNGGVYSIGDSNVGLNVFGDQKYYISTGDLLNDRQNTGDPKCNLGDKYGQNFCGTSEVQQGQYSEINIRPAGDYVQPVLPLTQANCKLISDNPPTYDCTAEWVGNPLSGRKDPITVYLTAKAKLDDGTELNAHLEPALNPPPSSGIAIAPKGRQFPMDKYELVIQGLPGQPINFSLDNNNLKLEWGVVILPAPGKSARIASSLESSSAQSGRYYIFSKGEEPTALIPDAKDKRVGAWSSYFKMPFSINGVQQSINVELAEGYPLLQFDVENGAVPAITPLTTAPDEKYPQWIKNGPGDISNPGINGMLGQPIEDGIIIFSTKQKAKDETIQTKDSGGKPIAYTRYRNADTVNYYAIYVPPCSYWALGFIKQPDANIPMAQYGNVLHLGGGINTEGKGVCTKSIPGPNTHFVIASLGSNIDSDQKAIDRAQSLAKYAFNYLDTTSVQYSVSSMGMVTTNFSATLLNGGQPVEKIIPSASNGNVAQEPNNAVLGLTPNQQLNQGLNYLSFRYGSIIGYIQPFIADCSTGTCSFQTQLQYNGILPYMPWLADNDVAGKDQQAKFLKTYQYLYGYRLYNMSDLEAEKDKLVPMSVTVTDKTTGASCTLTAQEKDVAPTATCTDKSKLTWDDPNASYYTFFDNGSYRTDLFFYLSVKNAVGRVPELTDLTITGKSNGNDMAPTYQNNARPAYSNYDRGGSLGGFYDTYAAGKRLNQMLQVAPIIKQMQINEGIQVDPNLSSDVEKAAEDMFATYFTREKPYPIDDTINHMKLGAFYFAWDKDYNSLLGFPEAYTSAPQVTDHVFHYGYWVYAAGQIAAYDADFVKQYKDIISYLVFDYTPHHYVAGTLGQPHPLPIAATTFSGTQCDGNQCYYDLGAWDAYLGRTWATGINIHMNGPNLESSSEQINAYAGMILWGAMTNQPDVMNEGIYLYTTAVHSAQTYWFGGGNGMNVDTHANNQKTLIDYSYPSQYSDDQNFKGNTAVVYQGGLGTSFFGRQAYYGLGIQTIPMTGATLYLGNDTNIKKNFDAVNYLLANWELDPRYIPVGQPGKPWAQYGNNNTFQVLLAEYAALGGEQVTDPTTGLLNKQYWDPDSEYCLPKWRVLPGTYTRSSGNACMDDGETRFHAYSFIRAINDYGVPQYDVGAPTYADGSLAPFYSVFSKDGKTTHVVFNAKDSTQTISFQDGTSCSDVAAKSLQICGETPPAVPVITWDGDIDVKVEMGQTTATATWNAATIAPTGDTLTYAVSLNGIPVPGCQGSNITTCSIDNLKPDTDYAVRVSVTDTQNAKVLTVMKSSKTFRLLGNITPPAAPPVITFDSDIDVNVTGTSATASWTAATIAPPGDTLTYAVSLNGTLIPGCQGSNITTCPIDNLKPDTDYTVSVSVSDADNAKVLPKEQSSKTFRLLGNITPPVAPPVITFDSDIDVNVTGTSATASWTAATIAPPGDTLTYAVSLNGTLVPGCQGSNITTCPIDNLKPDTDYIVSVSVSDADNAKVLPKEQSSKTFRLLGNITPPVAPPVITFDSDINISDIGETTVTATWTAATIEPAGDKLTYEVIVDGETKCKAEDITSCNIMGLQPGTTYTARVIVSDVANDKVLPKEKDSEQFTTQQTPPPPLKAPVLGPVYRTAGNDVTISYTKPDGQTDPVYQYEYIVNGSVWTNLTNTGDSSAILHGVVPKGGSAISVRVTDTDTNQTTSSDVVIR